MIYNFGLGRDYMANIAGSLKKAKNKTLLVLPKARQVLDFFRQGLIAAPVFPTELQFDDKKFAVLLKKKNLKNDEIKFVLKILVWQKTNWQTETILDLNLSFFGGQFRNLITGGKLKENKTAQILACDHSTFLLLSAAGLYKDRQVLVCGLDELEKAITSNIGTKTSWGYISYLLKSFYKFELNGGQEKFKAPVEAALLAGDLFFGLVNALFKTAGETFQYVKISRDMEYDERYVKIKNAAESYSEKLQELNKIF